MLGIITEYNPFHNGHKLHIEKSKLKTNSSYCIVVMSGNFTQRGEVAIFDKYARTKMALLNGADIVLELPLIFATSSAELFSLGSVDILNKTNIVSKLCFGSEEGNLDTFFKASSILTKEPKEFNIMLNNFLDEGLSFASARLKALEYILSQDLSFLKSPNNILALEYIKAIHKLKSNIKPYTILREKASFHSEDIKEDIASATAIRLALKNKDLSSIEKAIPKNCYPIFSDNLSNMNSLDNYSSILSYIIRTSSLDKLKNIADIGEGLENKIISNANFKDINSLLESLKSKRYAHTRLQRCLLHILLDITKQEQAYLKQNFNLVNIGH